jgi:hypothetical protein
MPTCLNISISIPLRHLRLAIKLNKDFLWLPSSLFSNPHETQRVATTPFIPGKVPYYVLIVILTAANACPLKPVCPQGHKLFSSVLTVPTRQAANLHKLTMT